MARDERMPYIAMIIDGKLIIGRPFLDFSILLIVLGLPLGPWYCKQSSNANVLNEKSDKHILSS